MKPGAIIIPKTNVRATARFYVRSKTKNGWVRCHMITQTGRTGESVFKFRAREMEVVG